MSGEAATIFSKKESGFRDDSILTKRQPMLHEDGDQLSLENHTNFGRVKKRTKAQPERSVDRFTVIEPDQQTIRLRGSDHRQYLLARDFYEHSNFLIDTLKEDFCQKRPGGWFEFNLTLEQLERLQPEPEFEQHPVPELPEQTQEAQKDGENNFKCPRTIRVFTAKNRHEQPHQESPSPLKEQEAVKKGRWSAKEHQLFLEALRLFGKDWELIEKHIGSRDIINIRSHAQKFLLKLVKFIEGKSALKDLTLEEAEFYYGTLNQRLHKHLKKNKLVERTDGPSEQATDKASEFNKWTARSRAQTSTKSIAHSVTTRQQAAAEGSIKMSFRSLFEYQEDEGDAASEDNSTGSDYNKNFDLIAPCHHDLTPEYDGAHRLRVGRVFREMPDLDSDDEDPDISIVLEDIGFEFDLYRTITQHSFLLVFFYIHVDHAHLRQPIMNKKMMAKIQHYMENQDHYPTSEDFKCVNLGESCFPEGCQDLKIDLEKTEAYCKLEREEQKTIIYIRYNSKKRGLVESPRHFIPYPMSQSLIENFRIAHSWLK